jgi:hypothetical protein
MVRWGPSFHGARLCFIFIEIASSAITLFLSHPLARSPSFASFSYSPGSGAFPAFSGDVSAVLWLHGIASAGFYLIALPFVFLGLIALPIARWQSRFSDAPLGFAMGMPFPIGLGR